MSLILFMLLVVIVLAVGVRVLEAGSKIGLALAILVAVVLGFHLVSQQTMIGQVATIQSAVADQRAPESPPQIEEVDESQDAGQSASSSEASATVTDTEPEVVQDAESEPPVAEDVESEVEEDAEAEVAKDVETSIEPDAGPTAQSTDADDLEIELVATPGKPIVPPRPQWVEAEPADEDGNWTIVVSSGPQGHLGECPSALDAELERVVGEYIDEYLGPVCRDKFKATTFVSFPAEYIRHELVAPEKIYDERIQFSFGPMYQSHAQVAFTPAFRAVLDGKRVILDRQWERIVVTSRLTGAAIVFGLVLALLAVVSGYFRLDTATRGFYAARLQFLATVAILAVIVAGVLLAKNVDWM